MKKRIVLGMLACASLLAIAACNDNKGGSDGAKTEKMTETTAVAQPKEMTKAMAMKMQKRGKLAYCTAAVSSAGAGQGGINCDDKTCKAENPVGTVRYFQCTDGDCPIAAGTTYSRQCDELKFLNGCTVTYKDVTKCE